MWIMASDGKSIVDSSFVERFCLVEKPDAVLIVASYSAERIITIGRYADKKEAASALSDLHINLAGNSASPYIIADSILYHGEKQKRDAQVARRGGS